MTDSEIFRIGVVVGVVNFLSGDVQGAVSGKLFLDSEILHDGEVAGVVIFLSGSVQGVVSSNLWRTLKFFMTVWCCRCGAEKIIYKKVIY